MASAGVASAVTGSVSFVVVADECMGAEFTVSFPELSTMGVGG